MTRFLQVLFVTLLVPSSWHGAVSARTVRIQKRLPKPEQPKTLWSFDGKEKDANLGCSEDRPLALVRKDLESGIEDTRCVDYGEFKKLTNFLRVMLQKNQGSTWHAKEMAANITKKFGEGCSLKDFMSLWQAESSNKGAPKNLKRTIDSLGAFEERGGSEFLKAWFTGYDKRVIPLLTAGESCLEECQRPVEPKADWATCNPDLPGNGQLKWVPLSKLRIPQRGARAMMTAPVGGLNSSESLPTIIGNIQEKPDPRDINCLQVCQEENIRTGQSIYWTEGTRRVIAWLLGGVPEEMSSKDLIPVKMVNCLRTIEDQNDSINFYVNEKEFGNGIDGQAILTKVNTYKNVWTSDGRLDLSTLRFWNEQTPILMYALADTDPSLEREEEYRAYHMLKDYVKKLDQENFWLRFAEDVSSSQCKDGECGSDIVEECRANPEECDTNAIKERIKTRALDVVATFSRQVAVLQ